MKLSVIDYLAIMAVLAAGTLFILEALPSLLTLINSMVV